MTTRFKSVNVPSGGLKNVNSKKGKIVLDPVSPGPPRSSDVKSVEYLFRGKVERDEDGLRYKTSDSDEWKYIQEIGQLPAQLISDDGVVVEGRQADQDRDDLGFTNPNLHRRIDSKMPPYGSGETVPRKYKLQIQNLNSYRTTQVVTHIDEYELKEYENDPRYTLICLRYYEQELNEIP